METYKEVNPWESSLLFWRFFLSSCTDFRTCLVGRRPPTATRAGAEASCAGWDFGFCDYSVAVSRSWDVGLSARPLLVAGVQIPPTPATPSQLRGFVPLMAKFAQLRHPYPVYDNS